MSILRGLKGPDAMVQRAATAALVALSVSGLVQQASFAASDGHHRVGDHR